MPKKTSFVKKNDIYLFIDEEITDYSLFHNNVSTLIYASPNWRVVNNFSDMSRWLGYLWQNLRCVSLPKKIRNTDYTKVIDYINKFYTDINVEPDICFLLHDPLSKKVEPLS
jgi:hypothetical protein